MEVVTEYETIEKNSGRKVKIITKRVFEEDYNNASIKEEYIDFLDEYGPQLINRSDWKKETETTGESSTAQKIQFPRKEEDAEDELKPFA